MKTLRPKFGLPEQLKEWRRTRVGWQYRILQSNGNHQAYGPVRPISDADGEAKFATAAQNR